MRAHWSVASDDLHKLNDRPPLPVQVPSTAANTFLVARALLCAAANLTTNELMRWRRFGYLADSSGGCGGGGGDGPGVTEGIFLNVFDRGPVANCAQFWRAARPPDWGDEYGQRMQVRLGEHRRHCVCCLNVHSKCRSRMAMMQSCFETRKVQGYVCKIRAIDLAALSSLC